MATKWHRATYRAHADIIKALLDSNNREVLLLVATKLAEVYKEDNANFQKDKFLTACGL